MIRDWTILCVMPQSTKTVIGWPPMWPVTHGARGDADPSKAAGDRDQNWEMVSLTFVSFIELSLVVDNIGCVSGCHKTGVAVGVVIINH